MSEKILPTIFPFNLEVPEINYPERIEEELNDYTEKIKKDETLSPFEKEEILLAVDIARIGHYNQKRKKLDEGEEMPYIYHNLKMAQRALKNELNDPLLHILIWLHDVPEDAPRNFKDNYGIESDSNSWINYIINRYKSLEDELKKDGERGYDEDFLSVLEKSLKGLTKGDINNLSEEEREELRTTPLYELTEAYITRGGIKGKKGREEKLLPEQEDKIIETVYALENLFDYALISWKHWRVFLVKALDVWNNFEDPEYIREDKVLRGVIASNLAHILGWYSLEHEINIRLLRLINVLTLSIPGERERQTIPPQIEDIESMYNTMALQIRKWWRDNNIQELTQIDLSKAQAYVSLFADKTTARKVYLISITPDNESTETTYPKLKFIYTVADKDEIQTIQAILSPSGIIPRSKKWLRYFGEENDTFLYLWVINLIKPESEMLWLMNDRSRNRKHQNFFLHLRQAPTYIQVMQRDISSDISINDIPEAGILNSDLREINDLWKYHLRGIIMFLYSPSNLSLHNRYACFLHEGKLYFINSEIDIEEIKNLKTEKENSFLEELKVLVNCFEDYKGKKPRPKGGRKTLRYVLRTYRKGFSQRINFPARFFSLEKIIEYFSQKDEVKRDSKKI